VDGVLRVNSVHADLLGLAAHPPGDGGGTGGEAGHGRRRVEVGEAAHDVIERLAVRRDAVRPVRHARQGGIGGERVGSRIEERRRPLVDLAGVAQDPFDVPTLHGGH